MSDPNPLRWGIWRRLRFFLWCVYQAAGMALTTRARLRAEAVRRMREAPPLAKTVRLAPPAPEPEEPSIAVVKGPVCVFGIRNTEANQLACWLHIAGGFSSRPDCRGQT